MLARTTSPQLRLRLSYPHHLASSAASSVRMKANDQQLEQQGELHEELRWSWGVAKEAVKYPTWIQCQRRRTPLPQAPSAGRGATGAGPPAAPAAALFALPSANEPALPEPAAECKGAGFQATAHAQLGPKVSVVYLWVAQRAASPYGPRWGAETVPAARLLEQAVASYIYHHILGIRSEHHMHQILESRSRHLQRLGSA